jgi:hypothetical protein
MKKRIVAGFAVVGLMLGALQAAPPAAPSGVTLVNGGPSVITNVTVSMPVGLFQGSTVYTPTVTLADVSAQMTWKANTEPDLAGYRFVYGDPKLGTTSVIDTLKGTNLVFFTLNTNITYYFYVSAYNTTAQTSPPSSTVIFQPTK